MLLYANEQYEAAEVCFERAQALAPAEARWPYYLGKTQSNLSDAASAIDSMRTGPPPEARLSAGPPAVREVAPRFGEGGREPDAVRGDRTRSAAGGRGALRPRPDRAGRGPRVRPPSSTSRRPARCRPRSAPRTSLSRARTATSARRRRRRSELDLYEKDKLGWPAIPDPYLADILNLKTGALARLEKRRRPGRVRPAAGRGRRARGRARRRPDARPGPHQPDPPVRHARPARQGRGALSRRGRPQPEPRRDPLQLRSAAREPEEDGGSGGRLSPGDRAEPDAMPRRTTTTATWR